MNTLQDTLATLLPDARRLIEGAVMTGSRECFKEDGEVSPAFFAISATGKVNYYAIPVMDDKNKPGLWAILRMLRQANPIAAMVSEVWLVEDKEDCEKNCNPDGTVKIMPRNHPLRKEAVMITLFEGRRIVTFRADITRNPSKLGEFYCFYDSSFPGIGENEPDGAAGAMIDGDPYPGEGN